MPSAIYCGRQMWPYRSHAHPLRTSGGAGVFPDTLPTQSSVCSHQSKLLKANSRPATLLKAPSFQCIPPGPPLPPHSLAFSPAKLLQNTRVPPLLTASALAVLNLMESECHPAPGSLTDLSTYSAVTPAITALPYAACPSPCPPQFTPEPMPPPSGPLGLPLPGCTFLES